jgi:3-hydroxyisobutyrate dehydrogenase-like beta-hydroxyacid dehydrogenase
MTNVTIIGAGNMARGIGTRLVAGGAVVAVTVDGQRDILSLWAGAGGERQVLAAGADRDQSRADLTGAARTPGRG